MSLQASCPTCGAPIEFGYDTSLVTVCESCGCIAGRGDGKLESYGKVADLVQTDSPLKVGMVGEVKGVPYEVTGRSQLKHSAGGTWDEWYVAFRDGKRWGWLAEAQGRYMLTFRKRLPDDFQVSWEDLQLEQEITIPQVGKMKVVEIGEATTAAAEGEIPYEFRSGERVQYADLAGAGNKFATLDNSEQPPALYVGGEFPLERLGISPHETSRDQAIPETSAVGVSCPSCGGALELRVPSEALRITCQYCDSLLDVTDGGSLKFLEKLGKMKVKPVIPLGAEGALRGRKYTVIGFLQRKVRVDGKDYYWQEYLLYTPRQPFHWLIHSDNHWSLGEPVSAGKVQCDFRTAKCDGKSFRLFARSAPVVTAVLGEFYWKVSSGERVFASDYVSPPLLLSREETTDSGASPAEAAGTALHGVGAPPVAKEVNYTLSAYVPIPEVEAAFGVKGLRQPVNVAPNQPYPHKGIYKIAFGLMAAGLLLAMIIFAASKSQRVYSRSFQLTSTADAKGVSFFTEEPVSVAGGKNFRVTLESPVNNSWVYLAGDIFNEETGLVQPFDAEVAYYSGYSGGERWSEGRRVKRRFVSSLPKGDYTLRFNFTWANMHMPTTAKVTIEQGVPRILHVVLLMVGLAIVPIGVMFHHGAFEARRWSESDFSSKDD